MISDMTDDGTGRPRWPYTSVEYLNRAGAARKRREELAANSPWIGLVPTDTDSPPDVIGVEEDNAEEISGEMPPARPATPGPEANKVPRRDEPDIRDTVNQVLPSIPEEAVGDPLVENDSTPFGVLPANITQMAALAAQIPTGVNPGVQYMIPDVTQPPPGYVGQPGLPENARAAGFPTAYPLLQSLLCDASAPPTFAAPPPDYGRFQEPRAMNVPMDRVANANMDQVGQPPLAIQGTQTNIGFKPMYVKTHGGPAGTPDARVQCPRCHDERWYIDVVTPRNPYYEELRVIDSRMRCLTCHGDVWQIDLLTSTTNPRTIPPVVNPGIHAINRVVEPTGRIPAPVGMVTPTRDAWHNSFRRADSGRTTPESGYGSTNSTPASAAGSSGSAARTRRAMGMHELIERRRAAVRRMLYGMEGADWVNEEL